MLIENGSLPPEAAELIKQFESCLLTFTEFVLSLNFNCGICIQMIENGENGIVLVVYDEVDTFIKVPTKYRLSFVS